MVEVYFNAQSNNGTLTDGESHPRYDEPISTEAVPRPSGRNRSPSEDSRIPRVSLSEPPITFAKRQAD